MDEDKILDNFVESKLVRFFVSYLNKTWVYGSLSYTDFDFKLMSLGEFISAIKHEIDFTIPYEKESEERLLPFKLFIVSKNELEILDETNYLKHIEKPGTLIFCTQDEFKGLENLDRFRDSPNGQQFFG